MDYNYITLDNTPINGFYGIIYTYTEKGKIMKVYQIVVLEDETVGHGSTAEVAKLASKDAYSFKPFPLYTNKALAENFASAAYETHFIRASVIELEVL